MQAHSTIHDVIKYRENCVFCNSKLKTILTSSLSFSSWLSSLRVKYQNNEFNFKLKYNSATIDLTADARIDAVNNFLFFDKLLQSPYPEEKLQQQAAWVFNSIAAHTESFCPSRRCGLNYYFSSNFFTLVDNFDAKTNQYTIAPVFLDRECINIKGFWVQNDLVKNKTNIYYTNDTSSEPITIDLINFDNLTKDKIINKIKMVVTFS